MFPLLNIIIIALILLIAYWWANQGLFSAILHLVSVIAAGAIALAVWEPLTYLQLSGTNWDGYAWGVTLIGVFAVTLFIIRFSLDKIVPANVDLPHWANLSFGFPVGGAAGVLTMGIVVIGAGYMQSQTVFMGLGGVSRSDRTGKIENRNTLWLPVHTVTADFYSYISGTSFMVPNPLGDVNPELDQMAVALVRDSFNNGKGAVAMPPDGATVHAIAVSPTSQNQIDVAVGFQSSAIDFNEQLTLSSSQVRLIGTDGSVVHPHAWTQDGARFEYESHGYYATSVPGQESADLQFHFRAPNMTPKYIQIRGTRFTVPALRQGGLGDVTVASGIEIDPNAPDMTSVVQLTAETRPIVAGTNRLPSGIEEEDGYFTTTNGKRVVFKGDGSRPPRNLRIKGVYSPEGARIVQVRVDHQSPANIFAKSLLERIPDNAQLKLVDTDGKTYSPIGYIHVPENDAPMIMLDPDRYVKTLNSLRILPEGSRDEMRLIFRVTINAEIRGLAFGQETVGQCNVLVEPE